LESKVKKLLLISSSIVVAASVAAIITSVVPSFDLSKTIEMFKPAPPNRAKDRASYPLNLVDGIAPDLSTAEWKSLFDGFSDKLADPTSAQIRKLARSTKDGIICGEVNAKNGFGGYVGFIPFTAGVILPRAMIVMPERRVVEAMPEQVKNAQLSMGCPK
jgi:hypothetical protein